MSDRLPGIRGQSHSGDGLHDNNPSEPKSFLCALKNNLQPVTHLFRAPRAWDIKLKINGLCVNKCSFCLFHDDPRRLEKEDIAYFFDMIGDAKFGRIIVNGGEPTIHPHFAEICDLLRENFRGRASLRLGTNLIPMSGPGTKSAVLLEKVLETYDHIEVGCDDEHRNIERLERLGPIIVGAGIDLDVNVVNEFCSEETKNRILKLRDRLNIRLYLSDVHHFYKSRPVVNDMSVPCRNRARSFLLNCDKNAYFCFQQEMEKPLFNLQDVSREELNYYFRYYDPPPYNYCGCCPLYKPELSLRIPASIARFFSYYAASIFSRSGAK
jgi:hypothetical protein